MKYEIRKRTRTTRFWLSDLSYQFWSDITKVGDKLSDFASERMTKARDKRLKVLRESVVDCSDTIRNDVKKVCKDTML